MSFIIELKSRLWQIIGSMLRLDTLQEVPEEIQLYQSLVNIMNSEEFDPGYEVDWVKQKNLL